MTDDPQRRKPDITRAKNILGWKPVVIIYLYFNVFYIQKTLKKIGLTLKTIKMLR